jgi:hypothetical protein
LKTALTLSKHFTHNLTPFGCLITVAAMIEDERMV